MSDTLGVIFALVGIGAIGVAAWDAWWGRASRTWPTVPGTITESRLQLESARDPNDNTVTETAKIEYHFEVDNSVFWGGRIAYDGALGRYAARQAVERYPRGATVSVAYDPTDPRRCVLEPGYYRSVTTAIGTA